MKTPKYEKTFCGHFGCTVSQLRAGTFRSYKTIISCQDCNIGYIIPVIFAEVSNYRYYRYIMDMLKDHLDCEAKVVNHYEEKPLPLPYPTDFC